jgi:hypothetical protein
MTGRHNRPSPQLPPPAPAPGATPEQKRDNFDAEQRKIDATNARRDRSGWGQLEEQNGQ